MGLLDLVMCRPISMSTGKVVRSAGEIRKVRTAHAVVDADERFVV
jgi:hypothetical protein